jgi:hypothetical protein
MGEMKNSYKILFAKPERQRERLMEWMGKIMKYISDKLGVKIGFKLVQFLWLSFVNTAMTHRIP